MPSAWRVVTLDDPEDPGRIDQHDRPLGRSRGTSRRRPRHRTRVCPDAIPNDEKAGLLPQIIGEPKIDEEVETAVQDAVLEQTDDPPRRRDAGTALGLDPLVLIDRRNEADRGPLDGEEVG